MAFIDSALQEPVPEDEQQQTSPQAEFTFQSLPPELLLEIFSFLELKPYIIAHGVCKEWQRLLPLADIHPIRRRLFNLFHHILDNPRFLDTRPWTLENLQSFDRQDYVNALLSQYPAIPEEFRIWILEWPARMATFGMWPGLPIVQHESTNLQWAEGVNWIAYGSPMLMSVAYMEGYLKPRFIPALLVWKCYSNSRWLFFEKDIPNFFGRVLITCLYDGEPSATYSTPTDSDLEDEEEDSPYIDALYPDWITYLEDSWDKTLRPLLARGFPLDRASAIESGPIEFPVRYNFCSNLAHTLPSPPWVASHLARFQDDMAR